ncbi:iron ABC transporter permease, partial [Dehalococcoidia bacterium]|nr:iron ABC transporter permease [Dehalococcoidia bacterium]
MAEEIGDTDCPNDTGFQRPMSVGLHYPWLRLGVGVVVVVVVGLLAASQGSVSIPPLSVFKVLLSKLPVVEPSLDLPATWETILWQLRLPRIVLAGIVGAALAISGAAYQGLFRNPLADPYLIGVASGAGLGATIVLVTGVPLLAGGLSLLPIAAFLGGSVAVTLAYVIARHSDGTALSTLVLAGVAIGSLASAITSLLLLRGDPDLRPVLSWLLGGFISAQWTHSLVVIVYLTPAAAVLIAYGRILNLMQLDEEHAVQLGVNVEWTKLILIVSATLCTSAAVSFSGLIGFVGLVAPHIVRLVWGGDYRMLLPMSALLGAG